MVSRLDMPLDIGRQFVGSVFYAVLEDIIADLFGGACPAQLLVLKHMAIALIGFALAEQFGQPAHPQFPLSSSWGWEIMRGNADSG